MKTKQGKEFNYDEILLYKVNLRDIIVIVNDEEQIKKYSVTGKAEDAPIAIIPYTDEKLTEIINSMKQIERYQVSDDGNVIVDYTDGTNIKFDSTNGDIIKSNLAEQRKQSQERVLGAWYNVSDAEKEKKKKDTQKKLTKGLAASLAAIVLAGGLYHGGKFIMNKMDNSDKSEPTNDDTSLSEFINPTDPRKTEESTVVASDFTKEAEELYQSTVDVNPFILKYQQVANITWDRELALEVVEYINGLYPTSMTFMNDQNANAEAVETLQAISLIIAGNLNSETKEEEMIDLSKYIVDEREKVFVHNAMVIARTCIQESIGEPMNGKILDEQDWSDVNKFSRQYKDSVDQLLNYEFDTVNDPYFLVSSSGARFVIGTYFQTVNNTIPQWSYVTRKSSETDQRTYDLYYRYFLDDVKKITYLPQPGPNGTNQYMAYWADEESLCHVDGPYTEDEMHAMAGLSLVEEQRNLGIEANPNIHQLGIQTEVDNRVEDARTELLELTNTYSKSK